MPCFVNSKEFETYIAKVNWEAEVSLTIPTRSKTMTMLNSFLKEAALYAAGAAVGAVVASGFIGVDYCTKKYKSGKLVNQLISELEAEVLELKQKAVRGGWSVKQVKDELMALKLKYISRGIHIHHSDRDEYNARKEALFATI